MCFFVCLQRSFVSFVPNITRFPFFAERFLHSFKVFDAVDVGGNSSNNNNIGVIDHSRSSSSWNEAKGGSEFLSSLLARGLCCCCCCCCCCGTGEKVVVGAVLVVVVVVMRIFISKERKSTFSLCVSSKIHSFPLPASIQGISIPF